MQNIKVGTHSPPPGSPKGAAAEEAANRGKGAPSQAPDERHGWCDFVAPALDIPPEARAESFPKKQLQWISWRMSPLGFQTVFAVFSAIAAVVDVWSDLALAATYASDGGNGMLYAGLTFLIVFLSDAGIFVLLWRGSRHAARFAVPPLRRAGPNQPPSPPLCTKAVPALYEVLLIRNVLAMKCELPSHARSLVQNNENACTALMSAWEAATESLPQLMLQTTLLSMDASQEAPALTRVSIAFSYVMVVQTLVTFFFNYVVHDVGLFGERLSLQGKKARAQDAAAAGVGGGGMRTGEGEPRWTLPTFIAALRHVELNPVITRLDLRRTLRHVQVRKAPHARHGHDAPLPEDIRAITTALGSVLRNAAALTVVDLGDNDLEPEAVQEVAAALRAIADQRPRRWLRALYLDGSPRMPLAFSDQTTQRAVRDLLDVCVLSKAPEEHLFKMRRAKPPNIVALKRPLRRKRGCCGRCPCCGAAEGDQSPPQSRVGTPPPARPLASPPPPPPKPLAPASAGDGKKAKAAPPKQRTASPPPRTKA